MTKPRLLVPISLQFSVRYLLRSGLLSRISQCAEPVIVLGWDDEPLVKELREVGCEVHPLTKARWGADYERARSMMNLWHQRRMNSPSNAIRERRQNLDRPLGQRFRRNFRRAVQSMQLVAPGGSEKARDRELDLFWKDTNAHEVQRRLRDLKIDALFCLTPFLADEEMTVRTAVLSGIPSATAILSFDNLTTRPWIPMTFDLYLLWNRHNLEQLHRGYPLVREREAQIVGSPQFDFYWRSEYMWSEDEWRARLALPAGRPVLLFAGGYYTCAPHEPQFLSHLDDAIENGEIPGKPVILFRRHPVDPMERWQPVLVRSKHTILDNPWQFGAKILGHTNIGTEDIRKLASTLYHSSVHVNVASTMAVDGAIFDKPQIGPAYDESPERKYHRAAYECYFQEHFLPITKSGGVEIVRSRQALIDAVRAGFEKPAEKRNGRQMIVNEICTFDDGKSTERVSSAVQAFVARSTARAFATTPTIV